MKKILTFIFVIASYFFVFAADVKTMALDVRTPAEYAEKHLEHSTLIDFKADDFKEKVSKLDKAQNYKIFCRSGHRAGQAVKIMKDLGFNNVENLGSIEDAAKSLNEKIINGSK